MKQNYKTKKFVISVKNRVIYLEFVGNITE